MSLFICGSQAPGYSAAMLIPDYTTLPADLRQHGLTTREVIALARAAGARARVPGGQRPFEPLAIPDNAVFWFASEPEVVELLAALGVATLGIGSAVYHHVTVETIVDTGTERKHPLLSYSEHPVTPHWVTCTRLSREMAWKLSWALRRARLGARVGAGVRAA